MSSLDTDIPSAQPVETMYDLWSTGGPGYKKIAGDQDLKKEEMTETFDS